MKYTKKDIFYLCTICFISILIFIYYIQKNHSINYYDEVGYIAYSQDIIIKGLFNAPHELRTYLYPLLISIFTLFSDGHIETVKIYFSIFQYMVFIFTVYKLAIVSFKRTLNKLAFYVTLILGFVNPYLIQSTTLFLTDILSSCLSVLALLYLVTTHRLRFKTGIVVSFFLYSSVMIRPSSAIFLPVLLIILIHKIFQNKKVPYSFIISGVLLLIVFYPQLYNNIMFFQKWTPLIAKDLYKFQSLAAVNYLKYGTVVIDNVKPQLNFYSPFSMDSGKTMFQLMISNPIHFIIVYLAHIFGVLDWGIVDTYIRGYISPSRLIGSAFLYNSWLLIGYGIYINIKKRDITDLYFLLAGISYIMFIATTCVESRFGYPVYLILLFFSGIAAVNIISKIKINSFFIKSIVVYVTVVISFFYLSYAMDMQTDKINWF